MGTIGITDFNSNIKFPELTRQEVLAQSLKDYRNSPMPPMTDGGMCLNSEGKKVGCNTLNQTVVNAPVKLEKIGDVLTAEDKFYESLGIKYHNTHMFGVASRRKGRLLVAIVLVAGYFAYKKFKK